MPQPSTSNPSPSRAMRRRWNLALSLYGLRLDRTHCATPRYTRRPFQPAVLLLFLPIAAIAAWWCIETGFYGPLLFGPLAGAVGALTTMQTQRHSRAAAAEFARTADAGAHPTPRDAWIAVLQRPTTLAARFDAACLDPITAAGVFTTGAAFLVSLGILTGGGRLTPDYLWFVPLVLIVGLVATPAALRIAVGRRTHSRERLLRMLRAGDCPFCGYNRGDDSPAPCPECGQEQTFWTPELAAAEGADTPSPTSA